MGYCVFCNEKAGIFRSEHPECRHRHDYGKNEIVALVSEINRPNRDLKRLETQIERIAEDSFIDRYMLRDLVASGWEQAVEVAFEDNVLSEEEERLLDGLKEHFGLSDETLYRNGALDRIEKGKVIRELLEGNLPETIHAGPVPFNLQKAERLVWVFNNVKYLEHKRRVEYVGGSQGVSVRVARGLYYRAGGFKGRRVETMEQVHSDTGLLGLTTKHLYYVGKMKKFRIRYDRIISFEPYEDGIGVQREAATATPQSFVTGDGWFVYNLVTNLVQI